MRGGLGGIGIWLISWLVYALWYGLIHGPLAGGWGVTLLVGLFAGLLFGLPAGLIIGLLLGLLSWLETDIYVTPPTPGKGVQVSKRNALLSGLPIGLSLGRTGGLGLGLSLGRTGGLGLGLGVGLDATIVGLGVGSIVGLQRGGGAYLSHRIPRWLLVRNGSIPRDYVAFLDYATRLILLRRRGGGYEFVHQLLLDHFAALESHSWEAHAPQEVPRDSLAAAVSVDQEPEVVVPKPNRGPRSGISS